MLDKNSSNVHIPPEIISILEKSASGKTWMKRFVFL